ncbi:diguanylate cyclase (GGDEF) domain-containing protein [Halopseudomonas sabulinigri]|uniref:cyclic-guanylate-specific phosphodiesterase n=1 Tax=Halopseudomonas sabulinigri TaxID=472181 RepID=A0A1H1PFU1_9GAMM|nr:bifunctional diguanylate cyclase/phosphodiesterase [Halopseudomonas sabulinigri]SDS09957.1 diguanylate cyclase (GGDEF) domain-containing protein [Halopseudomonas sabulinigri]
MLASSYNTILVTFSLIVAILASYTALNMAARVASARGRAAVLWLVGGSFAMGFGIWSMHFVGMLAFSLPIPLGYDLELTLLSLLIAIGSSAFALWLVCQRDMPRLHLVLGALLMGAGIAAMHYTGMAAMLMTPQVIYVPWILVLSVVIAIVASGAALWIAFRLRSDSDKVFFARIGASLVMGVAIVGMHYTGMAAAQFPVGSFCGAANSGIDTQWLAIVVIVVTLAVFAIALIISMLDARTSLLASSLDEANSELVQLALHDNLTRLPNRILLDDRLDQAIQKSTRERRNFAVLFMDLDGFKSVNDIYGHHAGDRLLAEVAQRILDTKRSEDTAARLGGDEFVLLIDPGEPEDAAALAQRLVESLAKPYQVESNTLHVSVSIGVAVYPGDGETAHELMVNADAAMYHSKEAGRNCYSFFEPKMNANAHAQLQLQQELLGALDRNEFLLHYQPKVVAPAGPMIGVEALLRWNSPQRGMVAPDAFLPLAERTGLIVAIGNWVINEACRQLKLWHRQGHDSWSIAVNLSTVQLGHPGLVDTVRDALQRHDVAPACLVLEVTESTAMRDAETSLIILDQLTSLGVSISIDDFGTGYSSLLYLKRLPANELKIDRGFVTELAQGNDDAAIVSAIIALGKTLGLKIVAEGVETAEQQALLTRLGCNTLQGYYLGRPVAAEKLLASLDSVQEIPSK